MNRRLPISFHGFGNAARVRRDRGGFTLVELLAASIASAMILLAIYGIFQRAIKMRDHATERIHTAAVRARAVDVIRNDLRNGLISGGLLASTLTGSKQGQMSRFPGYLRLTTTTGKESSIDAYGDVQQVEYFISDEPNNGSSSGIASRRNTGTLVRSITRDLLSTIQNPIRQDPILTQVESFEASFFDGSNWQPTWEMSGTNAVLPQAIRVRIQQGAPADKEVTVPPLEIFVPWTTVPFLSATTSTTGTATQ